MRIATWNLENFDLRHGSEARFEQRIATLRPTLERLQADILCLQEINAQQPHRHDRRSLAALDRLLLGSRYETYYRAHTARASGEPLDIHNLVVLSRHPIVESRQFRNELVPAWRWLPPALAPGGRPENAAPAELAPVDVSWDRPALYLRIDDGAVSPLHVVNLHLRASRAAPIVAGMSAAENGSIDRWAMGFFLAAQKQIGQALEVRLTVDRLFDREPGARIVVCGDMNAESHEMPVRLLCAAAEDTGLAVSAALALAPLEEKLPAARRFSVRHAGRAVMLDHMLASPELAARCTAFDVFNEKLPDEAFVREEVLGSLHAALVADFA
jgi:endonuclease/exonuclease/phosphatase family metal-dependent hydrolase